MSATSLNTPTTRMTPAHGIWLTVATLTGATVTAASPDSDLIIAALITMGGGIIVAFIGPVITAWARNRFHQASYRTEQETLNNHLIREMDRIGDDNEHLRSENEGLRDQITRLRRR